jgi:multisubunit Na+/H+ antiporter MnhF subunit
MDVFQMIIIAYNMSALLLTLSLIAGLYRLIRGPGLLDRILAFDLIALCVIALTVVFSLMNKTYHFLEITLIFCLLGFTTTIAFMDMSFRGLARKEDLHE